MIFTHFQNPCFVRVYLQTDTCLFWALESWNIEKLPKTGLLCNPHSLSTKGQKKLCDAFYDLIISPNNCLVMLTLIVHVKE